MKKNLLMVDYNPKKDWDFLRALEKTTGEEWMILSHDSTYGHGSMIKKLTRYADYFYMPFRIFLFKDRYKQVLAWQQFYGLILAFYFSLFHIKRFPEITVMTFIYKPKAGCIGKLYEKFVQKCVSSDYVQKIIVFSEKEKNYYADIFAVRKEKFECVALGIEDRTAEIPIEEPQAYYIAPGRSNRDYTFLYNAWNFDTELKIICEAFPEPRKADNINVISDCYGENYIKLLAGCRAVIVPLKDVHVSSAQLCILQAMMYGKPVIVTENDSVYDYIINGEDGVIIKKDKDALAHALVQVEQDYKAMSKYARKHYLEKFSLYSEGMAIGNMIKSRI